MYISKIRIENARCCEDFEVEFNGKGTPSLLLCGDNGSGKSTILRSIAMGLCDETSASGLLRELPGEFVKKGKDKATIEIELTNSRSKYTLITTISSLKAFERLEQKLKINNRKASQDRFPWEKIFIAAYGPGNRILGTADYQHYVSVDAVYNLFKNDTPLQNPELVLRRAIDEVFRDVHGNLRRAKEKSEKIYEYLRNLLKTILNLGDKDQVYLSRTGIKVSSRRWRKMELGSLGDGYKATTTWILDLISWWMLSLGKKRYANNKNIKGIVLIDEVEQHLHPKWQLKIMQLLDKSFPAVQFIATTHSPLVISGCSDIPVVPLIDGRRDKRNVHGWLAEDVYNEIMDMSTSRAYDIQSLLDEYKKYHLKTLQNKATRSEKMKMNRIRIILRESLPSTDPAILGLELENLAKDF